MGTQKVQFGVASDGFVPMLPLCRTSAYRKSRRPIVRPPDKPTPLSAFNIFRGLTDRPQTSSIPRSSSVVFHPTEMLSGLGGPDGRFSLLLDQSSAQLGL